MSEAEIVNEAQESASARNADGKAAAIDEMLDDSGEQLCSICLDVLPDPSKYLRRSTRSTQILATVEPCKHQYHDFCIRSWSERANTCPTCRCKFNSITLSVGEEDIDKVSIEDKTFPIPEMDDFDDMVYDDYDYDSAFDPDYFPGRTNNVLISHSVCILCDEMSSAQTGLVICNSCSGSFHPRCLGSISHSEVWNCPMCDSTQSSESIIQPANTGIRGTRGAARGSRSARLVNSFISSLRNEIRTNRRSALGLPTDLNGRGRISRSSNTGMFLAPELPPPLFTEAPSISKEESEAWKLYDRARKADSARTNNSSRHTTPIPVSGPKNTNKKVKKPVRKKHNNSVHNLEDRSSTLPANNQPQKITTVSQILSSMIKNSAETKSPQRQFNDKSPSVEMQILEGNSPLSLSYSSHETSPTSASLSSDDESNQSDKHLSGTTAQPAKLTLEALAQHDSRFQKETIDLPAVRSRKERRRNTDLSLSQKQLLQKLIVRTKLKPLYNENKIDTDEYTIINKSVSRKLYKAVSDTELKEDDRFIILLNKLIELRERFEYESYDSFAKRILSDVYTSQHDREKMDSYSAFVDGCIEEEIKNIRFKGR